MKHLPDWLTKQPIAHRGLHDKKLPENSIGAFKAAVKNGYAIELDIHLSRDNQLVVLHDDTTKRLTGNDLKITESDSADLTNLRLEGTEYHVPLLGDVLEVVAGSTPLLIEVKTGSPANIIGPVIQKTLKDYPGEYAIQSFDPRIVGWFHKHAPHVPRGQLSYTFSNHPGLPTVQKFLLRYMLLNIHTQPDFIAYEIESLPCAAVTFWRSVYKLPLLTWTVHTKADLQKARDLEANIIFERLRV
jgi:glycerophosphoryl diester phosphodiesterase